MKYKSKIIICAFISFFMMFLLNNVIAVGNVYQAVCDYDIAGRPYIIYRTLVKPSKDVLGSDEFGEYNTWYVGSTSGEPVWGTYRTDHLVFTKSMIGSYTETEDTKETIAGYWKFDYTNVDEEVFRSSLNYGDTNAKNTVSNWFNEATKNAGVYVKLKNITDVLYKYTSYKDLRYYYDGKVYPAWYAYEFTYNFGDYNKNTIDIKKNDTKVGITFSELFNSHPAVRDSAYPADVTKCQESTDSGCGEINVNRFVLSNSSVPAEEYYKYKINGAVTVGKGANGDTLKTRRMLYTSKENLGNPSSDDLNTTNEIYYIMDITLDEYIMKSLIDYVGENKDDNKIYVSAIAKTNASARRGSSEYFYCLTPGALLFSKFRPLSALFGWSEETLGKSLNGTASCLNLWDNQLFIPLEQKQDKTIYVQHIKVDVDSNGNPENFEVIETSEETLTAANEGEAVYQPVGSLFLDDAGKLTITETATKLLKERREVTLLDNAIQYSINAPDSKTEYKVKALDIGSEYKYAGASVEVVGHVGESAYFRGPISYIQRMFTSDEGLDYDAKFDFENNDKTVAVVNMYYVSKTKTVKVSHKKCEDDALTNCEQLLWFDNERYIEIKAPTETYNLYYMGNDWEETYYINEDYGVTAHGVVNHWAYDYKGYKLVDSGGTMRGTASECTSESKSDITIEFYYKEKEITVEEPGPKPEIDIPGTLTVKSAINVDATCGDFYSVPTDANSLIEKELYIGIKNTPRYILAGINVEKPEEDIEKKVTINVKISFGPHDKTWQINVPYSLSYYAIQEILMYKYQTAKINNAGLYNTSGEPLFNAKKINITPRNTSTLTFSSAANANIPITGLNDWKNYLSTKYKTNYMIPTDNPYDEEEAKRRTDGFELYLGHGYNEEYYKDNNRVLNNYVGENDGKAVFKTNYVEKNAPINEYIDFEQIEAYKKIELEGSATISINLLDVDTFEKIDANDDKKITTDDLEKHKENTDTEYGKLVTKTETLKVAENNYREWCTDTYNRESTFPCLEEVKDKFDVEWNACRTQNKCLEYDDETGECTNEVKKTCEDCTSCTDSSTAYAEAVDYDKNWSAAKNEYNAALKILEDAYEKEIFAFQNYDEAYYIQENIWKKYEGYNNEDIAKLLGLDIKFDYSSGNVKLGEKELMTVEKESIELLSNSESALSGLLVGDTCNVQPIKAKRQVLTAEQKKNYTLGIEGASWLPNSRDAVTGSYYENNVVTIDLVRLNGKRVLAGEAYYVIDTENKVGSSDKVKDNMYYDLVKDGTTVIQKVFEVSSSSKFVKYYGVTQNEEVKEKQKTNVNYNNKNPNSEEFNVYTPLVVSAKVNQDITIIDQSSTGEYNKDNIDVIQANSTFTINFKNDRDKVYKTSGLYDFTSRYKQFTYIKFEFAVSNVKYVGAEGYERSYGSVEANKWIGPIYGEKITVVPYLNTAQGESVTDQKYNYYVVAAAVNTSESWTNLLLAYINTSLDDLEYPSIVDVLTNPCGYEGKHKLSYYADTKGTLIIVNRMYDFRITDLKDLDWKKVFRNNESESYVNQHSGIAYYSGLNKWNTKNPTKYNEIIGRTSYEIGTSPSRVLPIGPYKNTDSSYIYAPKLGYRFSFDLKVTGTSNDNKYVKINPSFYYISKDGKTYYDEYKSSSGKEGIYLFYKNSSGKYIRVGASNDKYQIQFTPNDGYRALVQTDTKNLSSKVITLGSLTELNLKLKDTSTISANESSITYYGEYKLPNSIIAVRVNKNGTYDINRPLTDGYIGVVFNIQAVESSGVSLVYGKNAYNGKKNTSQWDYEGYLGISKPGEEYSTTLRLEKGTWKIDNEMYNKIKGTVILYDVDSKASNDFN